MVFVNKKQKIIIFYFLESFILNNRWRRFIRCLRFNTIVEEFILSNNHFQNAPIQELLSLFTLNNKLPLQTLDLSNNRLEFETLIDCFSVFSHLSSLRRLNIAHQKTMQSKCKHDDECRRRRFYKCLENYFNHCQLKSITIGDLNDCGEVLEKILLNNTTLKEIELKSKKEKLEIVFKFFFK